MASGWPSEAIAAEWPDINKYVAACPHESFVRSCREWAESVANSRRELLAVAYAIAVRQLKFPDTKSALAIAIARSAIVAFRSS